MAIVAAVLAAALVGACLFGVWHIVGGLMRGNPRALAFGVGLAAVTGLVLGLGYARLAPRFRRSPEDGG